jgi:uncharacterized membrane protein SpoIIM required for sporulation
MTTRDKFLAERKPDWDELDQLLKRGRRLSALPAQSIARVAALYRAVASDLMRARAKGHGDDVVAYLDALAGRAHNALYAAPPYRWSALRSLFARDFPRLVRRRARFFVLAALLFFVPGAIGFSGAVSSAPFAARVLSEQQLVAIDHSYAKGFGGGRDESTDTGMAGFYVFNNVGIAFRCFATGILWTLGSLFFLLYNGLVIGTVLGFVTHAGHGANIFTFICGHAPFELTAIVISGAAGLQMGYALVDTGGLTRWGSVRAQSGELVRLVLGAAGFLLIAALIEGFWSPSSVRAPVKWTVASVLILLVTAYLLLAGRSSDESS